MKITRIVYFLSKQHNEAQQVFRVAPRMVIPDTTGDKEENSWDKTVTIKQLQGHISRQHSLQKKGDISDFEPPSARGKRILPAYVTKLWNELKSETSLKKKSKKNAPKQQRDDERACKNKEGKSTRMRIPKHKWAGVIKEWDDDTSFERRAFFKAHPEFKNHAKRISGWRKILLKDLAKEKKKSS